MTRRRLAIVAGIALLCAAVPLAAVGRALLALPAAAGPAGSLPARAQVRPAHASLADRAARSLVGAESDPAFTQVVAIYRRAVALLAAAGDPHGPVEISRLVPKLRSASERAQAETMAGTLLAYSAGSGFGAILPRRDQAATETVLEQALADFRAAIRSDPGSEAAKVDLELLLRQRRQQAAQAKQSAKKTPTPTGQDPRRKPAPKAGSEHHAGVYATGSGY